MCISLPLQPQRVYYTATTVHDDVPIFNMGGTLGGMVMAAAMVWSGMSVGITNNRQQRPHWTNVGALCEGFVVKALVAFDSGVAYTKRLLFDDVRNNYTAPSPTMDLWPMSTLPQPAFQKE